MSLTVFGVGGIGGQVAARLALAGFPVNVVARGAHLDAMRCHGLQLQIRDVTQVANVTATDRPEDLGVQDTVIVSVKRTSLADAADALRPLIGSETRLVFIMNGLPWWFDSRHGTDATDLEKFLDPDNRFAALAPAAKQIWSVITSGGAIVAPGVVRNTTPGVNIVNFGYADNRTDSSIVDLAAMFGTAGYDAAVAKDIRAEIWRKILLNAGQATVATVTNRNHRQVTSDEHTRGVVIEMIREMVTLGRAIGIHLDDVDPIAMTSPEKYGEHIPSLLQDLRNGRRLEIDGTILAVRELARSKGIAMPHLRTVAAIIGAMSHDIAFREHR